MSIKCVITQIMVTHFMARKSEQNSKMKNTCLHKKYYFKMSTQVYFLFSRHSNYVSVVLEVQNCDKFPHHFSFINFVLLPNLNRI